MPQHSYKQLEEVYQRGVNKEHTPNPARTHPMSSSQRKGCPEMPINQTEPVQYSQDSQSDSNHEFEVTAVNPNAESTRLDGIHSHPQDSHAHTIQDKRLTIWTSTDIRENPVTNRACTPGIAVAQPARKMRSDTSKVSWTKHEGMHGACPNDIRELVAGIRDLSSTLIRNNSSMNTTLSNSNRRHQLSMSVLNDRHIRWQTRTQIR